MALQVWLPLNKSGADKNQGLGDSTITNFGAVYESSGKLGGCYKCTKSAGIHIESKPWMKMVPGNSFSVSMWIKGCSGNTWAIACTSWELNFRTSVLSVYPGSSLSNGGCAIYQTFDNDTWYHIAFSYNGDTSKLSLYLNGEFKQEYVTTYAKEGIASTITLPYGDTRYINDFRIYDHCLSPKEVKEISKGLVLHYPLNDAYVEGTSNLFSADLTYHTNWNNSGSAIWNWNDNTIPKINNSIIYSISRTDTGNSTICCGRCNLVAGKTYTASVYVYLSGNTDSNIFYVRSVDTNVSTLKYNNDANPQKWPQNQWIRATATFTSSTAYNSCYICSYLDKANSKRALTCWQIEEKDHATPYTPNTRNETTVYDCSGYQNNGTIEEFKAAGNNLVTGLTAGGQTTVSGETVTTSGVDADTYFTINLSESIVVGQTYTLSCIGENIPTDGYFGFPLGWQGNTSLMFNIKNGYNEITFTANDGRWGTNRLFMDDYRRATAYMNKCEFTGFKLYKHSIVNSGLNAVFDSPRYKIGAKFNGQHAIWLSSPLGSGAKEELTVSFWHKPNSQGNYRTIASNNYPHSGFWIGCNCEGYGLWYYGDGFYVRSQNFLSNDVWYHCALTYKNQTYQWYLNGVPVTTSTSGTFKAPTFSSSISIGGNTSGDMKGSSEDYRQWGSLSDFRIYSTALSADDIKELYNTSAYVLDNGTLLTYNLEE